VKQVIVLAAVTAIVLSARSGKVVSPEAQLKRSCTRCHGLNVIQAQRLSREEWDRELDKMIAMGAKVGDREQVLKYLASKYGNRIGDPGEGKK
jgi:hypothetical protein